MEQLIKTPPTMVVRPYSRNGTAEYTTSLGGSGTTVALDETRVDPMTGLASVKVTIPATNVDNQDILYDNITTINPSADDVWTVSFYLPDDDNDLLLVQLLLSDASSANGSNYRSYSWLTTSLQKGYNVVSSLHVEDYVDGSTYGHVGTNVRRAWNNTGTVTDTSAVNSIAIRIRRFATGANPVEVYLGAVHRAPRGWAKSAIMFMADDVPISFYNLAIPILDSYGWKGSIAVTSQYSGDPTAGSNTYLTLGQVRELHIKGYEVWSHMRQHEDMDTSDTATKTKALQVPRDYWRMQGISSAAKYTAWPFGKYDDESIQLAKDAGYKLARGIHQGPMNPLTPGINPYYLNAFPLETENSWQVDSFIKGCIDRGESAILFGHNVVPGGSASDTYPQSTSLYEDHFARWCALINERVQLGDAVVVDKVTDYFKICGVDPDTDTFME